MPAAHSKDLAWRVVMRYDWYNQSLSEICDPHTGLAVSRHYVQDVLQRYETTGDVETHQGQGADHWSRRVLTRADHFHIIKLISETPRATLKDHRAQFVLESGVVIPYSSFCSAVHQLGFTRKKIRALAYKCDKDKAAAFLREVFTFHSVEELGVLDETSKDFDSLKGGFGYSLRGTVCSAHDQALLHMSVRTSCLVLHTVQEGFLDWAMTPGTFNKEYFLHVTTENFVDWRGVTRRPMLLDHIKRLENKCWCILLDNASIHKCDEFVARVASRGGIVRFIPPYCHFLSTLDNGGFGALVQWLRGKTEYVQSVGIEQGMEDAFYDLNSDGGRLARRCFRNCEYM